MVGVGLAGEHVEKDHIRRCWCCDHLFQKVALHEDPAQVSVFRRLPAARTEDAADGAVAEVGEFAIVHECELQRIEVVFKTDDVHRSHRARCGLRLVAKDRGHGIGGSAEAHIPDHQRRGGLRVFMRSKT